MINPFYVRWLQGWTFQLVLMEGKVQVEAHGFGICIRTALLHGETPQGAADRLVLEPASRVCVHVHTCTQTALNPKLLRLRTMVYASNLCTVHKRVCASAPTT